MIILRTRIVREDDPTPTPSPQPSPDQTAAPPQDPLKVVLQEHVSRVLNFIPIGFASDNESLLFVQIQGGTADGTVLGAYKPATTEAIAKLEKEGARILQEWQRQFTDAGATPAPDQSPPPTPTPGSKLVVQLSDQLAFDYDMSPDRNRVCFLAQQFEGAEIVNRAIVADLVAANTNPVQTDGLPAGQHLRPLWRPDNVLLAVGVLPADGQPGGVMLANPAGGPATPMAPPPSGFDEPLSWSPEGAYLAVASHSGSSLANPGSTRLELVAMTGQRLTVAEGADNATKDTILGWFPVPPPPSPAPEG